VLNKIRIIRVPLEYKFKANVVLIKHINTSLPVEHVIDAGNLSAVESDHANPGRFETRLKHHLNQEDDKLGLKIVEEAADSITALTASRHVVETQGGQLILDHHTEGVSQCCLQTLLMGGSISILT